MVFDDTYVRKLPPDYKGLVVSMIKAQSPAATAKLEMGDVITQFNNEPITDLASFEKDVKAFRQDKPKEALVLVVLRGSVHADDPHRAAPAVDQIVDIGFAFQR